MLKYLPKKLAGASFLLSTLFFISCEKNLSLNPNITAGVTTTTAASEGGDPGLASEPPAPVVSTAASLYNLNVNWNNITDGGYGYARAQADFKNVVFWGNEQKSQISGGKLRTTLLKNSLHEGGVISRVDVPDASEYQLEFDMMFDQNFDFSWGGKVGFGFLIGEGYTGGVPGTNGNGGSFRIMWYKNTSAGRVFLKPYVYYKDQPGTYGNDFGKTYPATGSIAKGVWHNVQMYVKSNSGSNADGRIRLVINGTTIMDQAIRWTTNDMQRLVKNICFETFRGGGESYWQSSTDGDIYFDNVSWTAIK